MNASTVACIMERYSWREPNIIVWSGIGISYKLGPVIFQNIGQCRGNGVMGALYIHHVLRHHMVTFIARHRNYTFQHDNIRAHYARTTSDFLQQNDMDGMPWPVLSRCLNLMNICVVIFKDLLNSNQCQQRHLNLVHPYLWFGLVFHLSTTSFIQWPGNVLL